jgi:hypothetical protein
MGLAGVFSSCIKEDLTDCPLPLQVVFSYENAHALAQEDLKKATLFIFDTDNKPVTSWSVDNPVLNTVYEPDIELVPNTYNFVVWFNLLSPYECTPITGNSDKEGLEFRLQPPLSRQIDEPAFNLPVSLYGTTDDLIKKEERVHKVTIPVNQNTNRINLTVHGLLPAEDLYRFSITDNNGNYSFRNEFLPCDDFTYTTSALFSPGSTTLNASLTVLKLAKNHPSPLLTIRNETTGEVIFPQSEEIQNNLVQLILAAYPDNDFDQTHVYDIEISFTTVGVTIQINGWNLIVFNNEMIPD